MAETNRPLANRILVGLAVGGIAGVASLALGRVWPDSLVFVRQLSTSVLDPAAKTRLLHEFGGAAQKHIASGAASPQMNFATVVEMFMPKNLFGAVVGHTNTVIGDVLPLGTTMNWQARAAAEWRRA